MDIYEVLVSLWPILIALISLIIVLEKMHYAIGVLDEKIKVAFDLINKHNDSHR